MFHKTPGDPSWGSLSPPGPLPRVATRLPPHPPYFFLVPSHSPLPSQLLHFPSVFLPSSLLTSFSLSVSPLPAWVIFPPPSTCLSVWVSTCKSLLLPASVPLSLSHCLPGSPSQHCCKLASLLFSLLSVCQSRLLPHTRENG